VNKTNNTAGGKHAQAKEIIPVDRLLLHPFNIVLPPSKDN
jgi:hypothetical protein